LFALKHIVLPEKKKMMKSMLRPKIMQRNFRKRTVNTADGKIK